LLEPELDNLRAAHAWAIGDARDLEVAVVLGAAVTTLEDFAAECVDWLRPLQAPVEQGAVAPAIAARYWRALASDNMTGHLPRALQLEAAQRARTAYHALGQPRREFSSTVQLARHRLALGQLAAAQAAADEARQLVGPDWPGMLRIRQVRLDAYLARRAGRIDEAVPLYRDAVRVGALTGDWLLEVTTRISLADLHWEAGPIDEAARVAGELVDAVRARPVAQVYVPWVFGDLLGILSEMGRVDEAWAVAVEAWPAMHRLKLFRAELLAHLFWRRGQAQLAAQVLGAAEAKLALGYEEPLQNDQRLMTAARAGLATELAPDALAAALAAGAALRDDELAALIADGLARPPSPGR
jgi:hypothetical protein